MSLGIDERMNLGGAKPEVPALTLPDKPSVAVLPFINMSGDPEQEFVSDGVAEDVITALSHYPSLFVIARTCRSTFSVANLQWQRSCARRPQAHRS